MEILLKTSITAKRHFSVMAIPNSCKGLDRSALWTTIFRQLGLMRDCQANNNANWQLQPHDSFQELYNLCYSTSVMAFKPGASFPKAAQ